jgi:hypothetical protein
VLEPDAAGWPDEVVLPLATPEDGPVPDVPAFAVVPDCEPPVGAPPATLTAADPLPLETAPDVPVPPQAHSSSAAAADARRFRAIAEVGDRVTPTVLE